MNITHLLSRLRFSSPLVLVLLSVAVSIAGYLQALNFPFVADDLVYISTNTRLAKLPFSELWKLLTEPYNTMSEFLPLRELSYWLDMSLFGQNPSGFRMHNILLYLLCLPLVYGITFELWRYFRPKDADSSSWAAAAVTALFVLHSSHTDAVVWISGRKDILSGVFSLLALWLAVRAKREQGLSRPLAAATLIALLAAMLSKATAVAMAPVIATLWIIFWRDTPVLDKRRSMLLWPLAIMLLAAYIAVVFAAVITSKIPLYFGIESVTRSLAVLGWLTRLSISPESRHYFYPVFEDPYLPAMVTLGISVLAASAVGLVMIMRRRSLEGLALVIFLFLCIPSIQLIPYAPPSLVSDRFVFLAVWPVILLVVALSWRMKPVPRAAILLVFAIAWGLHAAERTRDWRSLETLIDTDLRAYPEFYMPIAYKILDVQLPQKSIREASETAKNIADTEFRNIVTGLIQAHAEVSIAIASKDSPQQAMSLLWKSGLDLKQPPSQSKWNSPVYHFWRKCQYVLATEWSHLAGHFPDDASILYSAGLWSLEIHYFDDAVIYLTAATQSPNLAESVRGTAFKSLGLALMSSNQVAQAEVPLRAALTQSPPDLLAHCALSAVYKLTNRPEEAARSMASCRNGTSEITSHH